MLGGSSLARVPYLIFLIFGTSLQRSDLGPISRDCLLETLGFAAHFLSGNAGDLELQDVGNVGHTELGMLRWDDAAATQRGEKCQL